MAIEALAKPANAWCRHCKPGRGCAIYAERPTECENFACLWLVNDLLDERWKLATFGDYWSPRTITTFNDCDVMVVKVKGEFTWHKHDDTDDFFLVLKGNLDIELRDRTVTLGPGELYVVPKGVEHRPVAREEVHLMLIEPTGTPNTGDKATAAARKLA
jgi:mannose-6-phosphate isomerase-like protein (cupin superfamily)